MIRRFRRDSGGQSLIEFALILPVFLTIVLGMFDAARAVWQVNTLAYAAREGSRYAIVHGSTSLLPLGPSNAAEPNIVAVVRSAAIGVPSVSVATVWPDGNNDRQSRVSVDATAPFVPLASQYFTGGAFKITLRAGSMLVIQR